MTPYYADGTRTLYHGDALALLPTIRSAGVVCLDPPYSMVPNAFGGRDDGAAGTSAAPVMLLDGVLRHTYRILAEGGIAPTICDWRRTPDVTYLATLRNLRVATCVAWTRTTVGPGGIFRSAWDPMLILSKGTPTVVDRSGIRNVIEVNKPRGSDHPYEKPAELWGHVLQRVPPTVVLDPFSGTGTSSLAASRHGHQWIGFEADERWCELQAKRMAQEVLDFGGAA